MQPSVHRSHVLRIAVARGVSVAGSEAAYVGLVSLVLARTHSIGWLTVVLVAWIGVGGLASPFAGALGDRFDRRLVMIGSDLGGAACFAALAFVSAPAGMVALAGGAALAEAPFFAASSAAMPNLVGDDELPWANSTITAGRTLGGLIGPLAGGLLVATVGAELAFVANAASFAASALLVLSVRRPFSRPREDDAGRTAIGEGFRIVARDPFLRVLVVSWSLFLLGIGLVLVAELPLARLFGVGAVGYGALVAGWSAGGLLGTIAARRALRKRAPEGILAAGMAGMSIAIGLIAGAPWFVLAVALLVAGGVADAIAGVAEETLMQRRTSDAVRSRVTAAIEGVVLVALGLGLVLGGAVIGAAGPRAAYAVAGVLGLAGAALLAVNARTELAVRPR